MINKVKANEINTIFYIGNIEQWKESLEYLNNNDWVWLHDGFYYYREPIEFPFLIFADNTKNMMISKMFEQYKKENFYKILLRQQKLLRVVGNQ